MVLFRILQTTKQRIIHKNILTKKLNLIFHFKFKESHTPPMTPKSNPEATTLISFEGNQYDPYFILDVTPDDSDEHIANAFKKKVKRYHPDKTTDPYKKIRYKTYFQIIHLSYKHITENRRSCVISKCKASTIENESNSSSREWTDEFGKGYKTNRINSLQDYSKDTYELKNINVNQFANKKFNPSHFNKLFVYNKHIQNGTMGPPEINDKALIKSSDGFLAYNSLQLDSCANVCSYNGLMIASDHDNDAGYWGWNYSDYEQTHIKHAVKNPTKQIVIPKEFDLNTSHSKGGKQKNIEQKPLYDIQLSELQKKEKEDKNKIMKHITVFDPVVAKKALHGELEMSPSFLGVLKQHHEHKTIQN